MANDDARRRGFASPPCSLHELQDQGLAAATAAADVRAWRAAERARLVALRLQITPADRGRLDAAIAAGLDNVLPAPVGLCIAVYWPIRGEPDLATWYHAVADAGGSLALPEIVHRSSPLCFRAWQPGQRMRKGVLNIPVPESGAPLQPDVVVSPLVGYDDCGHRLGNGGGYYDRTLAAMPVKPLCIGVGYERCALRTIYPQPFDVPMNYIVTESSVTRTG